MFDPDTSLCCDWYVPWQWCCILLSDLPSAGLWMERSVQDMESHDHIVPQTQALLSQLDSPAQLGNSRLAPGRNATAIIKAEKKSDSINSFLHSVLAFWWHWFQKTSAKEIITLDYHRVTKPKLSSTHRIRQDANSWHLNFPCDAQSVHPLQRHPVVIVQHMRPIHCNLTHSIVI